MTQERGPASKFLSSLMEGGGEPPTKKTTEIKNSAGLSPYLCTR